MHTLLGKEINRASLVIYISMNGKMRAPSNFFFLLLLLLINRIDSIIFTHKIDQRRSINDDVDFYHQLMYMT